MLRIHSYPTVVLAAPDGKILGTIEGFQDAPRFYENLQRALAAVTNPEWMLRDYQAAGVREYAVLDLRGSRVQWFVLRDGQFHPHAVVADGLFRSTTFPGLWLDPKALVGEDVAGVLRALQRGLEAPEHAEFVGRLQARKG